MRNLGGVCVAVMATMCCMTSYAGVREQAKTMHDRIAGVPPSEAVLLEMALHLETDDYLAAADIAMANDAFLNATIASWVAPWTNRDQDPFVDLNDYIATVAGIIRDDIDYRQVLFGDIIYTADPNLGLPAYSNANNDHYVALQTSGAPLQDALVQQQQSQVTGLASEAVAGVMTTRAASQAFFILGTNRAMFRFTLMSHMCRDMEQLQDNTLTPDRIRQDVSRSPGGDARVFLNNCVSCHSGMDPMAQAFAYYNFEYQDDPATGQLVYNSSGQQDPETGSRVVAKYHINAANFPYGFITPDDSWSNYWREGLHRNLGWSDQLSGSGNGAASMGQELAYSEAFAQCAVEKVFSLVCLRSPADQQDRDSVANTLSIFKNNGYGLKRVFAEFGHYCSAEEG